MVALFFFQIIALLGAGPWVGFWAYLRTRELKLNLGRAFLLLVSSLSFFTAIHFTVRCQEEIMKKEKKPYSERTDLEKIESNWTKTRGLLKREEWSLAIVRAATAVEIAANLVVSGLNIRAVISEDATAGSGPRASLG